MSERRTRSLMIIGDSPARSIEKTDLLPPEEKRHVRQKRCRREENITDPDCRRHRSKSSRRSLPNPLEIAACRRDPASPDSSGCNADVSDEHLISP